MKLGTVVKTSFIVSYIIIFIGAYFKTAHLQGSETLLITGVIATCIFIISAIIEVRTSVRIDHAEKTVWTIAFIFLSMITGLVYFALGRRRIAANF